jgi:hypothetical protein
MEKIEAQTTAIQKTQAEPIALELSTQAIEIVKENIWLCEQLVTDVLEPGVDWGTIPNVSGVSLWDPGATKIMAAFNCYPMHNILSKTEGDDLISFTVECNLFSRQRQQIIGSGIGACSTKETKYKYRWLGREDALREGYTEVEIKAFKKKREQGREERYRVPNPEYGELVNTIVKMAAKRSEVDAAQSLPGVASALRKLFLGMDIPNWKAFESKLQVIGLNHERAKTMLGIKSFKTDWLDKSKTLDEAFQILKQKVQGGATNSPKKEEFKMQDEKSGDIFREQTQSPSVNTSAQTPAIDNELLTGWRIVKSTLERLNITDSQVRKWFKHHNIEMSLSDLEADSPPERIRNEILSKFQDVLDTYVQKKRNNKDTGAIEL